MRIKLEIQRNKNHLKIYPIDTFSKFNYTRVYGFDWNYFFDGNILNTRLITNDRIDSCGEKIIWNHKAKIDSTKLPKEIVQIFENEKIFETTFLTKN